MGSRIANSLEDKTYQWILEAKLGRMPKASDISDEAFKAALNPAPKWTMIWELTERLQFPTTVVLAKARTMIKKKRGIDGCYCGCRGDFYLIEENLNQIQLPGDGR